MRPLLLSMKAFGPFREEQTVDFRRLGSNFFLIQGPTGAGKTSLLDAMCYALYGKSTGDRDTYRSHHAGEDTETRVRFEFALGDDVYRAERRLTKGGKPLPSLEILRGEEWELLIAKKEIGKRIEELLGFNLEQFRRVVMLPQGQFARFLLAPSAEKEGILNTLFRTRRYEEIASALAEMQRAAAGRMESLAQGRLTVFSSHDVSSMEELKERSQVLVLEGEGLRGSLLADEQRLMELEGNLKEAAETSRILEELSLAVAESSKIEASAEWFRQLKTQVDRAEQADRIEEVFRSREEAKVLDLLERERADEAHRRCLRARERLEHAQSAWVNEEAGREEREDLQARIMEWRALAPLYDEVRVLEQEQERLVRDEHASAGRLGDLEARMRDEKEGIDALDRRAAELAALDAEVSRARSRKEKIERLFRLAEEAEAADRRRGDFEQTLESRRRALDERRGRLEQERLQLRSAMERRLAHQAVVLAESLHPGDPCPVCGSTEHPLPAKGSSAKSADDGLSGVLQGRVDDLEKEVQQLQVNLNETEQGLALERDRLDRALRDRLTEDTEGSFPSTARELFDCLQHADEACRTAGKVDREQTVIRQELVSRKEKQAGLEGEVNRAREVLQTQRVDRSSIEASLKEKRRRLPADLKSPAELARVLAQAEERLKESERRLKAAQQLKDEALAEDVAARTNLEAAMNGQEQAAQRLGQAVHRFESSLQEVGFLNESEFIASRCDSEKRLQMRREWEEADRLRSLCRDRLEKARLLAAGRMPVDSAPLEKERAILQKRCEGARSTLGAIEERIRLLNQAIAQIEAFERDQADVRGDWQILSRLSDAASGRSGRRITLQRYVLAYRLDEVLGRASERLRRMTNARYALRRSESSGDGRRTAGLDLEVFDHQTGRVRPVSSLSGGEGFLASLSLALALAEVVQSRTGGVRLDTIFIDEGFGSLDPEALDLAVATLQRLQEGGRMVGIISHVEELKNQIPAQIAIHPGPSGSRIEVRDMAG